jgi:hypothetical protein
MRVSIFATLALVSGALAGNCGPQNNNAKCASNECCSQYGWCGTTVDHCDARTCLKNFSGAKSSCKPATPTTMVKSTTTQPTSPATTFPTAVPEIDVCGHAQGGVTCPGAGANGYFYRCCSSAGHCKNTAPKTTTTFNTNEAQADPRMISKTRTSTAETAARPVSESATTRRRLLSLPPQRVFRARERHADLS